MDKPDMTTLALIISMVSGTIGLPVSSFRAAMFAAQRTVAMLMKIELLARCRPTQILCQSCKGWIDGGIEIISTSFRTPVVKGIRTRGLKSEFPITYKGCMSFGYNPVIRYR